MLVLLLQYIKSATYRVIAVIHSSVFTNDLENSGYRQFWFLFIFQKSSNCILSNSKINADLILGNIANVPVHWHNYCNRLFLIFISCTMRIIHCDFSNQTQFHCTMLCWLQKPNIITLMSKKSNYWSSVSSLLKLPAIWFETFKNASVWQTNVLKLEKKNKFSW